MHRSASISLKAGFLLVVFSLSTVIGFACSLGVEMGFNRHHHPEEKETIHEAARHHANSHHHQTGAIKGHSSKKDDGNCCKGKVVKITQADKTLPQNVFALPVTFPAAFIASFYTVDAFAALAVTVNNKYFVRSYHPPIANIRIAIQSFQI